MEELRENQSLSFVPQQWSEQIDQYSVTVCETELRVAELNLLVWSVRLIDQWADQQPCTDEVTLHSRPQLAFQLTAFTTAECRLMYKNEVHLLKYCTEVQF